MRIGILTYHDLNNFGAQLQATGVQRFLAEMGHDSELIDFQPPRRLVRYAGPVVRAVLRGKFSEASYQARRRQSFRKSMLANAKVSGPMLLSAAQVERKAAGYDVLVCGSDANYVGYAKPYILDFGPGVKAKRVSYAASLGSYKPSGEIAERMKASLAKFSDIMVRDPTAQKAVWALGGQVGPDRRVSRCHLTPPPPGRT